MNVFIKKKKFKIQIFNSFFILFLVVLSFRSVSVVSQYLLSIDIVFKVKKVFSSIRKTLVFKTNLSTNLFILERTNNENFSINREVVNRGILFFCYFKYPICPRIFSVVFAASQFNFRHT